MQIDNGALVLVADGAKMLLFRNAGDAAYPKLELEEGQQQETTKDSDIKSDSAGRAMSGQGGGGGTMGENDFHQQAEDRFAADAAALLRQRALANEYEKLIIVAPPRTLGELRKHYHKEVTDRLVGEINKDLTGHPLPEIERLISGS